MALYFLRGSLPWQGLETASDEKYSLILEQKKAISIDELCTDLPQEFATCLKYLREMSDPDRPDYKYICNLFDGLYRRLGFKYDQVFDWTEREFARLSENVQAPSASAKLAISKDEQQDTRARKNGKRTTRVISRRQKK